MELFLPSTGKSCSIPGELPYSKSFHTLDNDLLCGGGSPSSLVSCLQWSPETGTWKELPTLDVSRGGHVSWTPDLGIGTYLIGGTYSKSTTTLIKPDGTQEPGFQLKYETR